MTPERLVQKYFKHSPTGIVSLQSIWDFYHLFRKREQLSFKQFKRRITAMGITLIGQNTLIGITRR